MNTYGYVGGNPVRYIDPLGLYIPKNTKRCKVIYLSDIAKFTGQYHTEWGEEYTFETAPVPIPVSTPWSRAPDIIAFVFLTYHSIDYTTYEKWTRDVNFLYRCNWGKDECGNDQIDEELSFHHEDWLVFLESGTKRWVSVDQRVTDPMPIPDPDGNGTIPPGPMPPLPVPVPIIP